MREEILKKVKKNYRAAISRLLNRYNDNTKYDIRYWYSIYKDEKPIEEILHFRKRFAKHSKYWDSDYSFNFKKDKLLEIQRIILNSNENIESLFGKVSSQFSENYWLFRGYSKEEAKIKVSHIQSKNKLEDFIERHGKEGQERFNYAYRPETRTTNIEYWIKKGYTKEESKELLKDRQSTFSLEKCIQNHGEEQGIKVFNKRQDKWQNTLNSKSQEEIDYINSKKRTLNSIPIELKSDFDRYSYEVRKQTERNLIGIENIDKRGLSGKEGSYHLDHKFSIICGFKENVPIHIIASRKNLKMIPWRENLSKGINCSVKLEDLI